MEREGRTEEEVRSERRKGRRRASIVHPSKGTPIYYAQPQQRARSAR